MTWKLNLTTGEVTDHTGGVVAANEPPHDIPGDVLAHMEEEVLKDGLRNGLSERQIAILRDAVLENIEVVES